MRNSILVYLVMILAVMASACEVRDPGEQQPQKEVTMTITPDEGGQAQAGTASGTAASAAAPAAAPEANETAAPAAAPQPAKKPTERLEEATCDEAGNLGTVSCFYTDNNDLVYTVKNSGRQDLDGVWYTFFDMNFVDIGEGSDMTPFKIGDELGIKIPLSQYDETKKVEVYPVLTDKICVNKQLVLIPATNCR